MRLDYLKNKGSLFAINLFVRVSVSLALASVFIGCKENFKNKNVSEIGSLSADTALIHRTIEKCIAVNQSNYDSMFQLASFAMEQSIKINYKNGEASALNQLANYQRRKSNYPVALEMALQASRIFDSLNDVRKFVDTKFTLANIYKELGGAKGVTSHLDEALKQAKEAESISKTIAYSKGMSGSLNLQGIILRDIAYATKQDHLFDTVFNYYHKALQIIASTGENVADLPKLHNNIAQIHYKQTKNYKKALAHLDTAMALNIANNYILGLTYNYDATAYTYFFMGKYDSTITYGHKMIELSKEFKSPFRVLDAYNIMVKAYKAKKNSDSALFYLEASNTLNDSMINVKKTEQIAESQTKYETEKKNAEISLLNIQNKQKNNRLIAAGALGLALLVAAAIFLRQNKNLKSKSKIIEEQSDRLQWMMKELHHRVKNNLQIISSLLNLQAYRMEDEESINAIKESQLRVQAMSLMHQKLYQVDDVSTMNFKLYLTELVETLMQSYGIDKDAFELNIKVDSEMLDVDTALPMGLLANEIITNVFKYAYTSIEHPKLTISLKQEKDNIIFYIADNGVGMNVAKNANKGFGQRLISALTKQLKATCVITGDHGTSYEIAIPYQQKKAA